MKIRPWEGLAETQGTMRHDFDDMKALHATLSRPVHYPQNPYILDYADRHGILLIPEIPVWQFDEAQLANPAVLALARQQMQEMIEQAGNHPSIFAWSVANESATATAGGIAYFRAMRDLIRKLDPGRFVSYADDNLPKLERAEQSAANDADFLMMNQYFGTWHGPGVRLGAGARPGQSIVSEQDGHHLGIRIPRILRHQPGRGRSGTHQTLQEQMPVLAARDWIAGAILWCYQDYKSRRNLWPGQTEGYVEHGVVDEARQRKPSYDVWKEMNAPAKIDAQWMRSANAGVTGFTASVTPNAEQDLPYYRLHGYVLAWTLLDEKGSRCCGRRTSLRRSHPSRAAHGVAACAGRGTCSAPDDQTPEPRGGRRRGANARMAGVAAAEINMSRRSARELGCRPALLAALLLADGARLRCRRASDHSAVADGAARGRALDVHEHVRLTEGGEHIVSNVHVPSITVYLPPPEGASGAAVIVVPGGGHTELWMDHEGYHVAEFLADHGIAAFVLKYRLAGEKGSRYKVEGRRRWRICSVPFAWYEAVPTSGARSRRESASWDFPPAESWPLWPARATTPARPAPAIPSRGKSSRPSFQALLYPAIPHGLDISRRIPRPLFSWRVPTISRRFRKGSPNSIWR